MCRSTWIWCAITNDMKNIIILLLFSTVLNAQKSVDIFVFNKAGADLIEGNYGKYSALDPIELPDGYALPMRIMKDSDLRDAFYWINLYKLDSTEIREMPKLGQRIDAGFYYKYFDEQATIEESSTELVKCILTHDRTALAPDEEALRWVVKEAELIR